MIFISKNVTLENSSGVVLLDTSEIVNPYLTKTGPANTSAGAQVTYEIAHGNAGTEELTTYKVTDVLPSEVDITTVSCTLNQAQIPSFSLYITTSSNEEKEILVLENQTEDSDKIDLTPYLNEGDTVKSVIFVGSSCSATSVTDYSKINLYGTVMDSVEPETTILNVAKTSVIGESSGLDRSIIFNTSVEATVAIPIIYAEDVTIAFGSDFDALSGVSATDADGNDLTSSILVVYNTVNTYIPGEYVVTYRVTDSNARTAEKSITVTVEKEESDPPTIYAEDLTISLDSEFDPLSGVSATDSDGNDLTSDLLVTYNDVDSSMLGAYKVTYQVSDASQLTTEKTIAVTVVEDEPDLPVIYAEDLKLSLDSKFDPLSGVSATDSTGNDLTSSIVVIYNDVDTSVVGAYKVTYQVSDSEGQTAEKTIAVTVVEGESNLPVIYAEDLKIGLDSAFDPLSGVSATDSAGNDLTSSILVIYNDVDTTVLGSYKVTYQVSDSQGQTVEKTIAVTVVEEEENTMEQAISDVIGSVALEETAIYGILDAEGAKIQKAVALDLTNEELLSVNSSVQSMVESLTFLEQVLLEKLTIVTSAT